MSIGEGAILIFSSFVLGAARELYWACVRGAAPLRPAVPTRRLCRGGQDP